MPKIHKPELIKKADKIISEFKEKDLKAYKKNDLRNLIYEIEETCQAELELGVNMPPVQAGGNGGDLNRYPLGRS